MLVTPDTPAVTHPTPPPHTQSHTSAVAVCGARLMATSVCSAMQPPMAAVLVMVAGSAARLLLKLTMTAGRGSRRLWLQAQAGLLIIWPTGVSCTEGCWLMSAGMATAKRQAMQHSTWSTCTAWGTLSAGVCRNSWFAHNHLCVPPPVD
jgi:hypothetical protein